MTERGLSPDEIIAKLPGPVTSPTSYRAFLKGEYIKVRPDWILNVVMEADTVRCFWVICQQLVDLCRFHAALTSTHGSAGSFRQ